MELTLMLFAGPFVFGVHIHNPVGVNVEGDLDLGDTTGSRGDPHQLEPPQALVVLGHLSLSLAHDDLHRCLPISCCREHLWLRTQIVMLRLVL